MIVGTAGHIDHGKTALVRALTGIDGDRLPEEKKRGITIELGYAYLPTDQGGMIGFVDMPGHEKLVRTMVAGASGIDFGLLLVAADDGIMPQTIEHLTVLSLLGVQRGAAILTKIDKADTALREERIRQVTDLLALHGLEDYPVLPASAISGEGIDAVRNLLLTQVQVTNVTAPTHAAFRMGLDRVFTLDGVGTVVAGSIGEGSVHIGDALCLAHDPDHSYRVRSLHVHNHAVEQANAGQRCAIGLVGLDRSKVERGQILCDPAIAQSSQRMDVWLQVAATEANVLRSGTQVHLHLATQDCMASVAILGQASLAPGESGLVQLVLQQAMHAWQGDRFILRDASATRTIAGGKVLDTQAPARYRQTEERLRFLKSQEQDDPAVRFAGSLASSAFGIHGGDWLRSAGLKDWPFDPASLTDAVTDEKNQWIIAQARLSESQSAIVQTLEAFHARFPEDIGPDRQRVRRLAIPRMPDALWQRLVQRLVTHKVVQERNGFVHLPAHGVQLLAAEKIVSEKTLPLLREGRFDPPWVRDIASSSNLPETQVRHVMIRMAKAGEVYQIVKDLYYHPDVVQQLADLAKQIGATDGKVTAARYRDATGLGRKRAIQILEFFDRIGFLRRVGDEHLLRPGSILFQKQG
ncbi:selenocysteine-specific translation elongation factor [Oxalicibacterium faecigallinarum]|uniref:Selenocysteine-specific elongation factor n=1 Tax=Oxalicibacterium faecigallinarum TaxID=573741 RepID=A0A8J3AUF6_9BURK|nr:selenocysteine-specific translation elongation factor [Oxalicibacterium faecigallinarum]GGI17057.1 selenocysteine-specific translation factor [Oxalicibacterium faecigallinarum]